MGCGTSGPTGALAQLLVQMGLCSAPVSVMVHPMGAQNVKVSGSRHESAS